MMISTTSSGSFVHTWKEEGGHRGVGSSLPNKWQVNIIGTIIIIIVIIVIIAIIIIIIITIIIISISVVGLRPKTCLQLTLVFMPPAFSGNATL